jgi:hypothetical protein
MRRLFAAMKRRRAALGQPCARALAPLCLLPLCLLPAFAQAQAAAKEAAKPNPLEARLITLDRALSVEDYPSILRLLHPLVPGGGQLAQVSPEEAAFDMRWLQARAPMGAVPLRYMLSWRQSAGDLEAARNSNALGRVGAMLDSKSCVKPVPVPMYNLLESNKLGDNQVLRSDEAAWAKAIDAALRWYGPSTRGLLATPGTRLPSAKWLCGDENVLPEAQAQQARAAYWALIKKNNDAALKGKRN